METEDVLAEVHRERASQNTKWGEQNHDPLFYFAILAEEVGEVAKEVVEHRALRDRPAGKVAQKLRGENMRAELIQVAAVAVAMVECLDRGKWTWGS